MTTINHIRSTLRTSAWPSCYAQAGMHLVGKDRPLSGRTKG